jgi:hypothetical protein
MKFGRRHIEKVLKQNHIFVFVSAIKSSPVTGLEWPRGFQEVKVPRFHDNGTR